ncbi:MAG: GNAT family N-acetyltransferase [Salibacteraceae bacterium]
MEFTLRPWTFSDLNRLVEIADNPKIAANLTNRFEYPYTRDCGERFISMATSEDPPFVLCIDINGQAAGGIGVHTQTDVYCKNMEMGYWLAEQYWGHGIITEAINRMIPYAFDRWDVNRIYAQPYAHNASSIRVLEKAGFKKEGVLKQAVYKNGEFLDLLMYAILRDDWVNKSS